MKRTIASAREEFQFVIPRLSDHWVNRGKQILADAEAKAKDEADKFVQHHEEEALALRKDALQELTATRDDLDALTTEGAHGRLPASEYSARLSELRERQRTAEAKLDRVEELADRIADVESDPVSWFDSLTSRTHLLQDFPW